MVYMIYHIKLHNLEYLDYKDKLASKNFYKSQNSSDLTFFSNEIKIIY